jgi:hypothetical protein
MRNVSSVREFPGLDSNRAHPEYKSEASPLQSACSIMTPKNTTLIFGRVCHISRDSSVNKVTAYELDRVSAEVWTFPFPVASRLTPRPNRPPLSECRVK